MLSDHSVCFAQDPKLRCSPELADPLGDPELESFAPRKLRQELVVANRLPNQLQLLGVGNTKIIASSEIQRIFRAGWWQDFYKAYPGTAGYAEFSQPVLSPGRDQALIYVAHRCDGLCGTGIVYVLARQGEAWHVIKEQMLWIS